MVKTPLGPMSLVDPTRFGFSKLLGSRGVVCYRLLFGSIYSCCFLDYFGRRGLLILVTKFGVGIFLCPQTCMGVEIFVEFADKFASMKTSMTILGPARWIVVVNVRTLIVDDHVFSVLRPLLCYYP